MPSRRQLLAASCGLVSTLAGCGNDDPDSTAKSSTASAGNSTTKTTNRTLSLELDRRAYLFRASAIPRSVIGPRSHETTTLSELNEATRTAVRTAIVDGPYTTSDPSAALLDGIEHVSLVEYQGTYYEVSHTFPTHTLVLERVADGNAPENRTVARDSEVVQESETVRDAMMTISPSPSSEGDPYVTTQLSDTLRRFLDTYDYLRYPGGVGELMLTTTERAPPYTVTATEASDKRLYGRQVTELSSFSEPARQLVREANATQQKTPLWGDTSIHRVFPDDIPQRLLDAEQLTVSVDGTLYSLRAAHVHWSDSPVKLSASIVENSLNSDASARFELQATNQWSEVIKLSMAGIAPFGVLRAYGPGGEQLLWASEYEQSDNVALENGTVRPQREAELFLNQDERVQTVYEFGWVTEQIASGSYVVPGILWAEWPTEPGQNQPEREWRSELFPYRLTLEVSG